MMSERKRCIRCERAIDGWARICPYCNWDQSKAAPAFTAVPLEVAQYKPPAETSLRKKLMFGGAGVVMLVLAFVIGMIINRDGAPKVAPEPVTESEAANVRVQKRADTQLVPTNEPGGIEQPITSAPASGPVAGTASNEWDRSDATAVSSVEYAQLAQRASAEKKANNPLVDPRSLTGAAYAQAPAPRRRTASDVAASSPPRGLRTRPVPQYQPVPSIRAYGTAVLDLNVGPDGRVTSINIRRAASGNNAALIGAVQRWRFKPATENGRPVSAPYSVQISFKDR
jgi:protein TonB